MRTLHARAKLSSGGRQEEDVFVVGSVERIIIKPGGGGGGLAGWHDYGGEGGGPFIERNALTVDSILTGQTCVSIHPPCN